MMEQVKVVHGKRDDPLRPKVFDPANVEVVDFMDTNPPRPPSGGWSVPGMPADIVRDMFEAAMVDYRKHLEWWQQRNLDWFGTEYPKRQCDHCGAHIRWAYVIKWLPTGQHFVVGQICGDERMTLPDRKAFDVRAAKMRAEAMKVRIAALTAKAQWAGEFPTEFEFLARGEFEWGSFFGDLRDKLNKYGSLSEKQVACVTREIEKVARKEARAVEEAVLLIDVPEVVSGRYAVQGEVVYDKWEDGNYGPSHKMLLKSAAGNKYWCSVPAELDRRVTAFAYGDEDGIEFLHGPVEVKATWSKSDRDAHFAFGKRPVLTSP